MNNCLVLESSEKYYNSKAKVNVFKQLVLFDQQFQA